VLKLSIEFLVKKIAMGSLVGAERQIMTAVRAVTFASLQIKSVKQQILLSAVDFAAIR